jgi:[ribosomal protein S18]-alanine N-acetyltransferase
MDLMSHKMNEQYAKEVMGWKYDQQYDFYDNELTNESLQELLNGSYYAVVNAENKLIGFFCVGESAQVPTGHQFGVYVDGYIDFGLGMHPRETGKGNGYEYCTFILDLIKEKYKNFPIRLTVANFNKRAIHLYEKMGFVKSKEFNSNNYSFSIMVKA